MSQRSKNDELSVVTVESLIGEFTPVYDGEEREYYFRFCGKANQSYLLETPEREPVYAAELTKFSLLGKSNYDFVDHLRGTRTPHKIGKTVTRSTSFGNVTRINCSDFTVDGRKLFELLEFEGYLADTQPRLREMNLEHTVYFRGQRLGLITGAGTCILPNVKTNKFTEMMKTPGLYKVYCVPENARLLFLWCLYFARSEKQCAD